MFDRIKTSRDEDIKADDFIQCLSREVRSIEEIDLEFLAKCYITVRDDQVEFPLMFQELDMIDEGVDPIFFFVDNMCDDLTKGLYTKGINAQEYFSD